MVPFLCEVRFSCNSIKIVDLNGNLSLKDVCLIRCKETEKINGLMALNQWIRKLNKVILRFILQTDLGDKLWLCIN